MSAMFEDWAYHDVFDAPQPSKPVAKSVLKPLKDTVVVPEPEVLPRAHTYPDLQSLVLGAQKFADVPLTKRENAEKWDVHAWLGAADPKALDFDLDIWESQMHAFLSARSEAGRVSELATHAAKNSRLLVRECDWILHELNECRTQDLATLHAVCAEQNSLVARQQELKQVRQVVHDVWEAQEHAAKVLRGPAPKAIPELPSILEAAKQARAFCEEHEDFVDSAHMEQQWRRCVQRALAIALAYLSHELRKITVRVSAGVKTTTGGIGAVQALIYAKFSADAAALTPTISLVREHSSSAEEPEIRVAFGDLQNIYFQLRESLVGAQIAKLAEPLDVFTSVSPEFLDACRTAFVSFREMFLEEQGLFNSLFGPETSEFGDWLSDMSDPVYATLRRVILHETDVQRLCDLIVLVGEDNVGPLEAVRSDAQNRLVFRANNYVSTEIARFEPEEKDFLRARFPAIDRSLELLNQVYQILSTEVFNELAHRCVRECIATLDRAVANRVSADERDWSIHCYHIKQLFLLQSQVVEFDLYETVVKEVDFSGIHNLLRSYRERVPFRELVAAAWASVPKVVETMSDAVEEIFSSLRRAVDRLCIAFVNQISFAKLTASIDKNAEFREELAVQMREFRTTVEKYIPDPEVQNFLVDSLQEAIMDAYTVTYRQLSPEVLASEAVMDIDTMAAWLASAS